MLPFVFAAFVAGAAGFAVLWTGPLAGYGVPAFGLGESLAGAAILALVAVAAGAVRMERRLRRQIGEMAAAAAGFDAAVMRGIGELREAGVQVTPAESGEALSGRARISTAEPVARQPGLLARTAAQDDNDGKVVSLEPALQARNELAARATVEEIARAIADGAVSAWYQPVIGLPARRTRILDCQPHLSAGNNTVPYDSWRMAASEAGALAGIDKAMLLDCLRLVRELKRSQKPGAALWRVSRDLLGNGAVWEETSGILKANRSFAPYLHCEIGLEDFQRLEAPEMDRLHEIREHGHRLAVGCDKSATRLVPALGGGLFSLVRAPAQFLLQPTRPGRWTADELRAAASAETEFVATGVTSEDEVIALIDHDIMLAQGPLLAPARPLRQSA